MPLLRPGRLFMLMQLTRVVILAVLWMRPSLWLFYVAIVAWGFNMGITTTLVRTTVQELAEEPHRAQILSMLLVSFMISAPASSVLLGWLIAGYDPLTALIPAIVMSLVIFGIGVTSSGLWRYRAYTQRVLRDQRRILHRDEVGQVRQIHVAPLRKLVSEKLPRRRRQKIHRFRARAFFAAQHRHRHVDFAEQLVDLAPARADVDRGFDERRTREHKSRPVGIRQHAMAAIVFERIVAPHRKRTAPVQPLIHLLPRLPQAVALRRRMVLRTLRARWCSSAHTAPGP